MVVYEFNPHKTQYVSEDTAFIVNIMLQSSVEWQSGTANRLKSLGIPSCQNRDCTAPDTQEFRKIDGTKDTWIAAYNPDYVITVWLGFDETTSQNYLPANAVEALSQLIYQEKYCSISIKTGKQIILKSP